MSHTHTPVIRIQNSPYQGDILWTMDISCFNNDDRCFWYESSWIGAFVGGLENAIKSIAKVYKENTGKELINKFKIVSFEE